MQLLLNDRGEITAYSSCGGFTNGTDYNCTIPDDFESQFKPSFYLFQNNEITLNPNYEEPVFEMPKTSGPTTEQQMINQLGLQFATLTAEVNQLKGGVSNV